MRSKWILIAVVLSVAWTQASAQVKVAAAPLLTDAPIVVAVGPGFTAGVDCHAVVESNRGHHLGRVLLDSSAESNTGIPGTVGGENTRRVLHAPGSGILHPLCRIGDLVHAGDLVARIDDTPLHSQLDGVVRGLLHTGLYVRSGFKVGDVDPRGIVSHCFTISDKALAIGGGVVEAILYLLQSSNAFDGKTDGEKSVTPANERDVPA